MSDVHDPDFYLAHAGSVRALAFAAASFIYVAVADLIPGLHRRVDAKAGLEQLLFIALGVALVWFAHAALHE